MAEVRAGVTAPYTAVQTYSTSFSYLHTLFARLSLRPLSLCRELCSEDTYQPSCFSCSLLVDPSDALSRPSAKQPITASLPHPISSSSLIPIFLLHYSRRDTLFPTLASAAVNLAPCLEISSLCGNLCLTKQAWHLHFLQIRY